MPLTWTSENLATWDANKAAIVGSAPDGAFPELADKDEGELIGSEWWRVEDGDEVVGYGWLDATWGWAPILLAVKPGEQRKGVGEFIVKRLEEEAHKRGLAYLFNVIPATHPDKDGVRAFLVAQGFEPAPSDATMLRRKVPR